MCANFRVLAKKEPKKGIPQTILWPIKIIVITFILSIFFSFLSQVATTNTHLAIAFLLLVLLIVINMIFDTIAVAATACDLAPLLSMASRKVRGSKIAVKLVKNAEKVNSICGDVIGDITGIIIGTSALSIALTVTINSTDPVRDWVIIGLSSVVAALTVGGKSIFKRIAMKNSKEIIMFVARILSIFSRKSRQ